MTFKGVLIRFYNLIFKWIHKLFVLLKYGIIGDFYVSPSSRLVGVSNIFLGKNVIIFPCAELNTSSIPSGVPYKYKYAAGRIFIGDNSVVKSNVSLITYGGIIRVGSNSSINPYTIIYGHGNVSIGDNVMIAAQSIIVSSNHNFSDIDTPMRKQGVTSKGIIISDDVWIGAGARILDGVTIESGVIVAAGSIVTKNVPKYAIVAGNPATILRFRNEGTD